MGRQTALNTCCWTLTPCVRSLKPANVLLRTRLPEDLASAPLPSGELMLADLGLAHQVKPGKGPDGASEPVPLSSSCGTPAYRPPEQGAEKPSVTTAADSESQAALSCSVRNGSVRTPGRSQPGSLAAQCMSRSTQAASQARYSIDLRTCIVLLV